jgi:PBP1b-binding outer membrane lipoprotein LpoB
MKALIMLTIAGSLLLAGCGGKEESDVETTPTPEQVPVKVDPVTPENGTSSSNENPVTAEEFTTLIAGDWKIDNIDGETELKPIQLQMVFTFGSDGSFTQSFPDKKLPGKWQFTVEEQKLTTALEANNNAVDSYKVLSITATQLMFYNGNTVTLTKI